MPRTRKKKKAPSQNPQLRLTAWTLALLVALVSLNFPRTRLGLFLELTAAVLFAVGTVWPRAFRGPYQLLVSSLRRFAKRAWFY